MFNIYIIQNLVNGKVYVGQTSQGINRLRQHRYNLNRNSHKNSYLQYAWNKYRVENFEFYILDSFNTKEEINEAEIYYIKWYKDLYLCYNLKSGGEGGSHSEETKLKIGLGNRGKVVSQETKEKIRKANLGRVVSEHTKKRLLESNLGKKHTEETKEKLRQANLGKHCSEETRQKRREIQTGKKYSEESRLKMSISAKNISDETRQKMSESAKNKPPMSEEAKRKIGLVHKGKPWSEARRNAHKISISKIKVNPKE